MAPAQPLVLEVPLDQEKVPGLELFVASDGMLDKSKPANGGLRLWTYDTKEAAVEEAARLASGMSLKHQMYNTGFSGGKLVCRMPKERMEELANDKKTILDQTGAALNTLEGFVYTGCDVNMSIPDMEYLRRQTPYVLASLDARGKQWEMDANIATASGVVGGVCGALDAYGGVEGKKVLVHGTGQVGAFVAQKLASLGALVYTYDINSARADIPGIVANQSALPEREFLIQQADILVPCSCSNIVDEELAHELRCDVLAGASNLPFRTVEARKIVESRGIVFVPECITSAGAIILDSVEMYDNEAYLDAEPGDIYAFVGERVRVKSTEFAQRQLEHYRDSLELAQEIATSDEQPRVGTLFALWKDQSSAPVTRFVGAAGPSRAVAGQTRQITTSSKHN
jgi:leucine dehydrogenase